MSLLRKIGAIALGASLLTTTAIVAQAEETEQYKLLTTDSSVFKNSTAYSLGDGYFLDPSGIVNIGKNQIAQWSKTGTVTPTIVQSDFDLDGKTWWTGDFTGKYIQFVKQDTEGNITNRWVIYLDKENNTIKTAYELGADWCYTRNDGYTLLSPKEDITNGTVTYTIVKPDGTSFNTTFNSKVYISENSNGSSYVWNDYFVCEDGKYCCYVVIDEKPDGELYVDERSYAVYGIATDGSTKKIKGDIKAFVCDGISYASPDNVSLLIAGSGLRYYSLAISVDDGTSTEFPGYLNTKYIDSDVAIVSNSDKENHKLINLSNGNVIAEYPTISDNPTNDLFLATTNDGKSSFINKNGTVIATFDKATLFNDDYALVIKDGKAYLIDKDMNCVSDKTDAENVLTLRADWFAIEQDGVTKLLTYTTPEKETETSEPTSEPTSNPTSEPTSEPTSQPESEPSSEPVSEPISKPATDIDNPQTGMAVAIAFGLTAFSGITALVFRKKR